MAEGIRAKFIYSRGFQEGCRSSGGNSAENPLSRRQGLSCLVIDLRRLCPRVAGMRAGT
jgi:hypothetical protein